MFEQLNQTTSTLSAATKSLSTLDTSNLALAGTASNLVDPLWQRVSSSSGLSASSPGVFTVGATGKVSLDYLFDGGTYEGELAIFSLAAGMDRWLQSAPQFFVLEAAARAISNSDFGHIVISDQKEGARFSGSLSYESEFNAGAYLGTKTFSMRPGEQFGVMLVPNGTIEEVGDVLLHGGKLEGDRLPLFSIPSLNTGGANQFAQLVNTVADGNSFTFEDLSLNGESDRDYNDMIFQIRGAIGKATPLEQVISSEYDWRNSNIGKAVINYAVPYTSPRTPKIGETVSTDFINQVTNKAGTFKSGEEKATAITTQSVFTQSEVEEWLTESKQQLATLRTQSNKTLVDVRRKIDSASGEIYASLSIAEAKFQLDVKSIRSLLDKTANKVDVDREQVINLLKGAEDSYLSAINQANKEFVNLGKSFDELRTRYEQLGGSSEDWAIQYRTLLDATQKEFDNIYSSGQQLERDSLAPVDNIKNQFGTLDGKFEKILDDAQSQYSTLQKNAIRTLRETQNQYQAIEASWSDWVGDTEAKLDVWAKILTDGSRENNASSSSSLQKSGLPLIGLIDTGFVANDPDIDYSRIILGKDWIEGDNNPLMKYAAGHGTQILKLIAATRDNGIDSNGINDRSPVWLGRAVGSDDWAQSLIEFVDAAKASNQLNAVVNLSFDLTQTNADGSITPRYQLTALERAALTYAQQNQILVVVAAGNENVNLVSALGQAGQEFDNIITVGAAEGWERASYSSFGNGIDIVAQGREGATFGTSIATAKVTGAASLVWAANPQLNYRQVINILRDTATDLSIPNWDAGTGFGLLNIPAAVYLAKAIEPEPYQSLGSILLQDMFKTLEVPEDDQQMLRDLYYYVDLEGKLTGETWNGTNGAKPTEKASFFLEAAIVAAVIYGIVSGGSPDDSDVQRAKAERDSIGTKWNDEFAKDEVNIHGIEEKAKVDISNKKSQITEALKNGTSPEDIANLRRQLTQIQNKFVTDYAVAQEDLLADQKQAAAEIAAADAQLEQAKKDFESGNNIFKRIGSKFIGPIQRIGSWFEQLPARIVRLEEGIWEQLKNSVPRVWDGDWWKSFGQGKSYLQFLSRIGTIYVSAVEVTGTVELVETALEFIKPNTRPLTDREVAIAKSVFGEDTLKYSLVRVDNSAFAGPLFSGRANTTFHTINSWGPLEDKEKVNKILSYTDANKNVVPYDVDIVPNEILIHELTHVWQYEQDGAIYAPEALINNSYEYGGRESLRELDKNGNIKTDKEGNYSLNSSLNSSNFFKNLNREQQGQFVQDYYHIRENDDPNIPGTIDDNKYLSIYTHILVDGGNSPSTRAAFELERPNQINIGIVS